MSQISSLPFVWRFWIDFQFLGAVDDQTFWSNGEVPRIHPPHGSRESWSKQPGFYEREAGGTCCSETDETCSFWSEFRIQILYIIYTIYIYIIYRGCFKAFVVHQLFKSTRNRLRLPHLKCSLHSARSGWNGSLVGWWGLDLPPHPGRVANTTLIGFPHYKWN